MAVCGQEWHISKQLLVVVVALVACFLLLHTVCYLSSVANATNAAFDNSSPVACVAPPRGAMSVANGCRQTRKWSQLGEKKQQQHGVHSSISTKLAFDLVDAHWQASTQPLTTRRGPMDRWFGLQQLHSRIKWKRRLTGASIGGSVVVAVDHRKSIAVQRYLMLCQNAMWMHKCGDSRCKRTIATIEACEPSTSGEQAATIVPSSLIHRWKLSWKRSVRLKDRQLTALCALRRWNYSATAFSEISSEFSIGFATHCVGVELSSFAYASVGGGNKGQVARGCGRTAAGAPVGSGSGQQVPSLLPTVTVCHHYGLNKNKWTGGGSKKRKTRMAAVPCRQMQGVATTRVCAELSKTGECVAWVPDDGNCFFSAIATSLGKQGIGQAKVRKAVVEEELKPAYAHFCEDNMSMAAYRKRMKKNKVWGGEMELLAAATVYGVEIQVYDTSVEEGSDEALVTPYQPLSGVFTSSIKIVYEREALHYWAVVSDGSTAPPQTKASRVTTSKVEQAAKSGEEQACEATVQTYSIVDHHQVGEDVEYLINSNGRSSNTWLAAAALEQGKISTYWSTVRKRLDSTLGVSSDWEESAEDDCVIVECSTTQKSAKRQSPSIQAKKECLRTKQSCCRHSAAVNKQTVGFSSPHVDIEKIDDLLLQKAGVDSMAECMESQAVTMDLHESPSPAAKVELCADYISEHLRARPSIPEKNDNDLKVDDGCCWPFKHCAFKGCDFVGNTDDDIIKHLACKHSNVFLTAQRYAGITEGSKARHKNKSQVYNTCTRVTGTSTQICECAHCITAVTTRQGGCTAEGCEAGAACPECKQHDNWLPMYTRAISEIEWNKPPEVGCSKDRRSCDVYDKLQLGDKEQETDASLFPTICAPMCFLCARILAHDACDNTCGIQMKKLFNKQKFGNMDKQKTADIIGLGTYLDEYGSIPQRWDDKDDEQPKDARNKKICGCAECTKESNQCTGKNEVANGNSRTDGCAFADWAVTVPFKSGHVRVMCCPEDVRCKKTCSHKNIEGKHELCEECEIPICDECCNDITKQNPSRPQLSLSNDLWFGYLPSMIYDDGVTYMELLCASVCHPTMINFQVNCYGYNAKNTEVHMHKHRLGARGNMTAFQVPWENVFEEMHRLRETAQIQLPRIGSDLLQLVQVALNIHGDSPPEEVKIAMLKGATVRRDVVLKLIEHMHKIGHRDYQKYKMKEVEERVKLLHQNDVGEAYAFQVHRQNGEIQISDTPRVPHGVMSEFKIPVKSNKPEHCKDNSSNVFQAAESDAPGKISVPASKLLAFDSNGKCEDVFRNCRVVGVDEDNSSNTDVDINTQMCAALMSVTERVGVKGAADNEDAARNATMRLTMGEARNQFEATFFLTAYAFLFPYSVGAPDLKFQARDRRTGPKVDFARDWGRCLVQRAEGQFRRDLTLPFALWNLTFRTTINISHNMYSIKRAVDNNDTAGDKYTAEDIANAAINISQCLAGTYETKSKVTLKVDGDIRKLRAASNLKPALNKLSKRMLDSFQATCKKIEGTQEVRAIMRHELYAYRVAKGQPILITFSPNERHNMIMIRLSRTRSSDPLAKHKSKQGEMHRHYGKLDEPSSLCDVEELGGVSVGQLMSMIPTPDERRSILAKDPLASVYGFRMLCKLALKALFGVRACSKCPECNCSPEGGCVDIFSNVANAEGGSFGLMEAYFGSIEHQKEDSQHLHMFGWVQCMHQYKTLYEIAAMIRNDNKLLEQSFAYVNHVCAESYADESTFDNERDKLEEESPDYEDDNTLMKQPVLPRDAANICSPKVSVQSLAVLADGAKWRRRYKQDVQKCQMRVNHHIHRKHPETNEREPMPYCKCKDRPKECSKGYPKTKLDMSCVVCNGVAKTLGLNASGKRNMLGAMMSPRNNEWLNGTHPAMLFKQRCNSDVKVTYRIPIMKDTHCKNKQLCNIKGCLSTPFSELMRIQAQSQRDQIGYITDYITKRQPIATNEIDKFVAGQRELQKTLSGKALSNIAVRHTQRLLSDALGRGTVRKAVESTNLLHCRLDHDVTAAESIKSHLLVPFPCGDYIRFYQRACKPDNAHDVYQGMEIDSRDQNNRTYVVKQHLPELYGHRGDNVELASLSPYEFHEHWFCQRVNYPTIPPRLNTETFNLAGHEVYSNNGNIYHALLTVAGRQQLIDKLPLQAGTHYIVSEETGLTRDRRWLAFPKSSPFADEYVMVHRGSPAIPRFDGRVLKADGTAEEHAQYMSIYLRPWTLAHATEQVPHITALCGGDGSWKRSWQSHKALSRHMKHISQNFMSTFSTRQISENDMGAASLDRRRLEVSQATLAKVTVTKRRADSEDCDKSFQFVSDVWGSMGCGNVGEQKDRACPVDIDGAIKAARESQKPKSTSRNKGTESATAAVGVTTNNFSVKNAVEAWVRDMTSKQMGQFSCKNAEQEAVVHLVAQRVLQEDADAASGFVGKSEPVRALITGGPGVGKSFVIKATRQLFDKLNYSNGTEYAFAGLQAVVAAQLHGQTLHSLFGLNLYGQATTSQDRISDIAAKLTHMRWIIIDEISQVTCELLGQCEKQARSMVQDVGTYRLDGDKLVRPWAGINVLYVGDFLQLPPPGSGSCLTSLPEELRIKMRLNRMKANVTHGLSLMWHDTKHVIELTEQVRCTDPWWNDVLSELRVGALTPDSHAFLHGECTTVPGSWRTSVGVTWGKSTDMYKGCNKIACGSLAGKSWDIVVKNECACCKLERARRHRVVVKDDKRLGKLPLIVDSALCK
jgi:hypothetical protein